MVQAAEKKYYTLEEYLALELHSEERHEYIDGEVVCVTGGTPNHNKIVLNLAASLNLSLKHQPYEVFVADQRLWIPSKRVYTYPDVMVIAQPLEYQEGRRDTLTNPLILVEVLSDSTQNYDRGDKFVAYRTIPTLLEYVLIDQSVSQVERYFKKSPKHWTLTEYDNLQDMLTLESLNFEVAIADLYNKVDFSS